MSRAKTAEEAKRDFLNQIKMSISNWASNGTVDCLRKDRLIEGPAFSILNIIDGTSQGLPSLDLVIRPHPDDKSFRLPDILTAVLQQAASTEIERIVELECQLTEAQELLSKWSDWWDFSKPSPGVDGTYLTDLITRTRHVIKHKR